MSYFLPLILPLLLIHATHLSSLNAPLRPHLHHHPDPHSDINLRLALRTTQTGRSLRRRPRQARVDQAPFQEV